MKNFPVFVVMGIDRSGKMMPITATTKREIAEKTITESTDTLELMSAVAGSVDREYYESYAASLTIATGLLAVEMPA